VVSAALAGVAVLLTGGVAGGSPGRVGSPSTVRAPLDAAMTTSSGTWVDLAMGDLGDLQNTFWQLLYLSPGGARFALVTPPGFADNGGIVSVQAGKDLVSGFQANQQIHFSPLASSTDGGRSWSPGILSSPLAVVPDALAGTPSGRVVALGGNDGDEVVSDAAGLSSWQRVVTQRRLASAAKACGVGHLSALAFAPGGELLVGASCTRSGEVGVLEDTGGNWRLAGPRLGANGSRSTAAVLRLRSFTGGVAALVALNAQNSTELLGTRLSGRGGWSKPVALGLGRGEEMSSSAVSGDGGLAVLVSSPDGARAEVLRAGAGSWTELPRPPRETAALAFEGGGAVDALAVDHSRLTVYRLGVKETGWQRSQVMQVPIQYGSSS
jgi:hypothetical protein